MIRCLDPRQVEHCQPVWAHRRAKEASGFLNTWTPLIPPGLETATQIFRKRKRKTNLLVYGRRSGKSNSSEPRLEAGLDPGIWFRFRARVLVRSPKETRSGLSVKHLVIWLYILDTRDSWQLINVILVSDMCLPTHFMDWRIFYVPYLDNCIFIK